MRTLLVALLVAAQGAFAGEADVVDVKVRRTSAGAYDFDVTVRSVDKGWDHYAALTLGGAPHAGNQRRRSQWSTESAPGPWHSVTSSRVPQK